MLEGLGIRSLEVPDMGGREGQAKSREGMFSSQWDASDAVIDTVIGLNAHQ